MKMTVVSFTVLLVIVCAGILIPKVALRSEQSLSSEEVAACRYMSEIYFFNHPFDRLVLAHQTVHVVDGETYLVKSYFPFAIPYRDIEIDLGMTFEQARMKVEEYNAKEQVQLDERWACEGSMRSVES